MVGIRTISTINPDVSQASLGYLIELMLALRSYKEGIVLVGGFSFLKSGPEIRGERIPIQIDFLGPEYGGTGKNKRHQRIQDDFLLRKARGADFVFNHLEEYELTGILPNGSEGNVSFYIADIVGSLVMKGITLGSRHVEKDAYDLYALVTQYKKGPTSVAEAVKPYKNQKLAKEALQAIRHAFRTRQAEGGGLVADFFEETQEMERDSRITDAFEQIDKFLRLLGM